MKIEQDTTTHNRFPILANSFIATTGLAATTLMPFLIGGLMDEYGFSKTIIGWVASANILGLWIGGIIATLLIGKVALSKVIKVGLIGLLILDTTSTFITDPTPMLILRTISGIFGGMVYAGAMAVFSGLKDSIKAFGIYVIVFTLGSSVVLLIQSFSASIFGVASGFVILGTLALLSYLLSFSSQKIIPTSISKKSLSLTSLLSNTSVLLTLIAYFTLMLAGGVVWTYIERIGNEAQLTEQFIGIAIGVGSAFAMLGGVIVVRLSKKNHLKVPLIISTICMIIGGGFLFLAHIPFFYFVSIALYSSAWATAIPYHQQIQTQFDAEGKVVSLGAMLNMGGRGVGPAMAAMFLGSSAFVNVVWISTIGLGLSLLVLLVLLMRMK